MNILEHKNLKVLLDKVTCLIGLNEIKLTKTEFNLLVFFLKHRNKIFSRRELSKEVWEKDSKSRAVDIAISRLRKKLGDDGKNIVTRLGFGYGFME